MMCIDLLCVVFFFEHVWRAAGSRALKMYVWIMSKLVERYCRDRAWTLTVHRIILTHLFDKDFLFKYFYNKDGMVLFLNLHHNLHHIYIWNFFKHILNNIYVFCSPIYTVLCGSLCLHLQVYCTTCFYMDTHGLFFFFLHCSHCANMSAPYGKEEQALCANLQRRLSV